MFGCTPRALQLKEDKCRLLPADRLIEVARFDCVAIRRLSARHLWLRGAGARAAIYKSAPSPYQQRRYAQKPST